MDGQAQVLPSVTIGADRPTWWRQALAAKRLRAWTMPDWLRLEQLPALSIEDPAPLSSEQILELLGALKRSTLADPHPLVVAVKNRGDGRAIAAFAWGLFCSWHEGSGEAKDHWAMVSLGLWGQDETVMRLTPLIREMPRAGLHRRAALGLDCLQAIGTDLALMQISDLAQRRLKYKSLKRKAEDCLAAIGAARNLTREQLEDRITPDCGLVRMPGVGVSRRFCYGDRGRWFEALLGDDGQLVLRDDRGKLLRSLPQARVGEEEGAIEAKAAWKSLKRQLSLVQTEQIRRWEQAMVAGRRWSVADFEGILLAHPVLGQMAQRLIWVGEQREGELLPFRVTEDWSYGDSQDGEIALAGFRSVGLLHPAQVSEAERGLWGELLGDYGLIQPFRQLTRTMFAIEPQEVGERSLQRFVGGRVPTGVATAMLQSKGWLLDWDEPRRQACHYKVFGDLTAIVGHGGDWQMAYGALADLGAVWFVAGTDWRGAALPLGEVSPVLMSEVIRLVGAIALQGDRDDR
jgi:hypothetical protein